MATAFPVGVNWTFHDCPIILDLTITGIVSDKAAGTVVETKEEQGFFRGAKPGQKFTLDSAWIRNRNEFHAQYHTSKHRGNLIAKLVNAEGHLELRISVNNSSSDFETYTGWVWGLGMRDAFAAWKRQANVFAIMTNTEKLNAVLKQSQVYMPGELWEEVQVLLDPANLAIMASVLGAWGVAHFFGVGWVVDILLIGTGLIALGSLAAEAGRLFYDFVTYTLNAENDSDIEKAARAFAEFVALVGVEVIVAMLTRNAGKALKGRKGPTKGTLPTREKRSIGEWKKLVTDDVAAKGFRRTIHFKKLRKATRYFEKYLPNHTEKDVASMLADMDLSKSVRIRELPAGTFVSAFKYPGSDSFGLYFAKTGTPGKILGIPMKGRQEYLFRLKKKVTILESVAADTVSHRTKELVHGGGTQYVIALSDDVLDCVMGKLTKTELLAFVHNIHYAIAKTHEVEPTDAPENAIEESFEDNYDSAREVMPIIMIQKSL